MIKWCGPFFGIKQFVTANGKHKTTFPCILCEHEAAGARCQRDGGAAADDAPDGDEFALASQHETQSTWCSRPTSPSTSPTPRWPPR